MNKVLPGPSFPAALQAVLRHGYLTPKSIRSFTSSRNNEAIKVPLVVPLPEADIHRVFIAGSGPGGQKINRTRSKAQLTHLPTGTVVSSQATRSRSQNFKIARKVLSEKVDLLQKGGESRLAKKQEKASTKKQSSSKKARRKYRKLEVAKNATGSMAVEDGLDMPDASDNIPNKTKGDEVIVK
jgi:peptide chain release factor